jgi:hypothetical protein
MSIESGMAAYRADNRPKPKALNIEKRLATFLGSLNARPDASIEVASFVTMFRASVPPRQQYQVGRHAVVEALKRLGLQIGTSQKRQCLIGYSPAPPATLIVDDSGKIREVA